MSFFDANINTTFYCVVLRDKRVLWAYGKGHDVLISENHIPDDTLDPDKYQFCKCVISCQGSICLDEKNAFSLSQDVIPRWWSLDHKQAALNAFEEWKAYFDNITIRKEVVNPFTLLPPNEVTPDHLRLLKRWEMAYIGAGYSPESVIKGSINNPKFMEEITRPMEAKIWREVGRHVESMIFVATQDRCTTQSAMAAVWAYYGSFFNLPREQWRGTEAIPGTGYPFQPLVDLWLQGLIPSCTGTLPYVWRLHGGPDGRVLWEGTIG